MRMEALSMLPTFSVLLMLAIGQHSRRSGLANSTETCGTNLWSGPSASIKFCSRDRICTKVNSAPRFTGIRSLAPQPRRLELYSRRSPMSAVLTRSLVVLTQHGNTIVSRAAELEDDYGQFENNSVEDGVMGIMSDVIQHCFKDECDGLREKVFDQMGSGLAALFRLWTRVAADALPAPIPIKRIKLPLYAKQRALLMPAKVAGKVALSSIAGPKRR